MEDTTLPAFMDGLYAYGMVLSRNQAMAADLVQETYLRALKAKASLRPDSNVKSWLFTILRNIGSISCATSAPGPKLQSSIRTRTSRMCPLQPPKIPLIST